MYEDELWCILPIIGFGNRRTKRPNDAHSQNYMFISAVRPEWADTLFVSLAQEGNMGLMVSS